MAARFTAISKGVQGTGYTLEVHDTAFGGAATEIEIDGFELAYDPDEQDDPISSIIASSLTFSIIIQPPTQSAINTFVSDMAGADEGRFQIKVTKGGNVWWVGFILTDQISIEDQAWADKLSALVIRAVDGISRLKDIDYNDDGTAYSGRVLMTEHLFNVLDKIGTSDFYGASDNFLYIISRWYENDMGAVVTDNPLSRTYIDHAAFISIDEEGNEKFTPCYDVLKELARVFLARFYYSGGIYRYDQVSEYREPTVTQIKYYKGATYNTSTTSVDLGVVETSDDIIRLGNVNARKFYFAPARKIELTFKHRNDRNYLAGKVWSSNSDPAASFPLFGRDGVSLWMRGKLAYSVDFTPDSNMQDCIALFKILITCVTDGTTYYAKQNYTVNTLGVITFEAMTWTTTSTDRISIFTDPMYLDAVEYSMNVNLETPTLPGSGEFATVSIDIAFSSLWELDGSTSIAPSYTESWEFSNSFLQLNSDDESALTNKSTFTKSNADAPNASLVLKYDALVSDSPTLGTLFVPSNLSIDNGGTEEISDIWAKGLSFGSGKKIHYLWLDEAMKLRAKSLARYEGQLLGSGYQAHNLVEFIDGTLWIMQRATYNSVTEIWSGDWWFVGYDDSLTGTIGPVINEPLGPFGPQIGPPPPPTGPKVYNPKAGVSAPGDGVAPLRPTGGHIVTTTDVALSGPVSSIPINACSGQGGIITNGDTVTIYDPATGANYDFTVTADVAAGDTTISVSTDTPTDDLGADSYVVVDTCSFVGNIRSGSQRTRYAQTFTSTGSETLTVTVNGGTLPANTAMIEVYYSATPIFETDDWTVSGSDIVLEWKPEVGVKIRVFFWE